MEAAMRWIAVLTVCVLAWSPTGALAFESNADDNGGLGYMLALMQTVTGIAAQSDDPKVVEKRMDEVFAGRNPEANRAAAGLLDEMTRDMSAEERQSFVAIARNLMVIARRDQTRSIAQAGPLASFDASRALSARKELNAMGLRYYDADQFLEAVKRDDALAVALYIEGRGVNLEARDAEGRTALDIARAKGNRQIVALLSAAR
jgi:hypothetical protein